MGLTTSYVWQGRRQSEVSAMIRHEARSVEEQQGVKRRHSNSLIDAARTGENRVLVGDGQGGFKLADSVDEISEAFERRLAQRKAGKGRSSPRKIRSDSNTAALFVLQLDPEFTGPCEGMSPEKRAEVERLHQVMIDQVIERMGAKNVISISHHWDETHPHVHIICTAMTPDDRVAYYQAVGNDGKRSDWAVHHDAMRQALRDSGYDATFERVGQGRKGETLTMFKRLKDQETAADVEVSKEWLSLEGREAQFDDWREDQIRDLRERDAGIKREAEKLQKKWERLNGREHLIDAAEGVVAHELENARETKSQAARELSEATATREAAQQAADTAVDEAVAAWERDELPRLRRKAVEDAEAEAGSVKQDAQALARETVDAAEQEAERLRQQTRAECERLRREARDLREQADADAAQARADAAQTRADAEQVRKEARQQGWLAGFDEGRQVIDEIADEFRNDLTADRFNPQFQSVNFKMRKQQGSAMQQQRQWKPDFELGQ